MLHGTSTDLCGARGQKRKLGFRESNSVQVKLLVDQLLAVNQTAEGKATLSAPCCGLGGKATDSDRGASASCCPLTRDPVRTLWQLVGAPAPWCTYHVLEALNNIRGFKWNACSKWMWYLFKVKPSRALCLKVYRTLWVPQQMTGKPHWISGHQVNTVHNSRELREVSKWDSPGLKEVRTKGGMRESKAVV